MGTVEHDHISLEGEIREEKKGRVRQRRHSCRGCHAHSLSKHKWPLALPNAHRWLVGFALGLLANLLESFLQTQMLAVANHWPPSCGVRDITQSSIHQSP